MQIPNCLAFEYLKSMASIGLASVSCAGLDLEHIAKGEKQMRCLCVGLGGGSLPLFLANKMQGCFVEVVEIDDTVISAATEFMGFPGYGFKTSLQSVNGSSSLNGSYDYLCLQEGMGTQTPSGANKTMCGSKSSAGSFWGGVQERISGFEADGAAYVYGLLEGIISPAHYYDLVFIDAFDGKDEVPSCLWSGGGPFLTALRDLLNPIHGTAVVNLHTDMPPPSLLERITGEFGPGFDPLLPGGRRVQEISDNYRNELLLYPSQQNGGVFATEFSDNPRHVGAVMGVTFTVAVPRQQNICLVVSRGINGTKVSIIDNLKAAACYLERVLKIPFHMSKRISRGFHIVQ